MACAPGRLRSACALTQSDQSLHYELIGTKFTIITALSMCPNYSNSCGTHQNLSHIMTKPTKWHARLADPDQPAHSRSLIRAYTASSLGNKGPKVSTCGQRRLRSDWADPQPDPSHRRAHRPPIRPHHAVAHSQNLCNIY